MSYDDFRKSTPYSQPDYQGDHVTLPDGGPTPTMWALAGFIEAVDRGENEAGSGADCRIRRLFARGPTGPFADRTPPGPCWVDPSPGLGIQGFWV